MKHCVIKWFSRSRGRAGFFLRSLLLAALGSTLALLAGAELRVDLNPANGRKDVLMPHWENWNWSDTSEGSRTFGEVTVTFRATAGGTLTPFFYKPLLVQGVHVGLDGLTTRETNGAGGIEMILHGLAPGKHAVVTYHNEIRDVLPASFDILVDGSLRIKGLTPTKRATNDYELAAAFLEVNAEAGKDVVLQFRPHADAATRSIVINGFEIDTSDPHLKAVKPLPANDDEHVFARDALTWSAPASAAAHHLFFGTDSNMVARATTASPEFKGRLATNQFALPSLDHMKTYFWRVDELHPGKSGPVRGEVWRFRKAFLAFPTAEGYGRFARGGRGGRVMEVTNLDDYDPAKGEAVIPGSYRAAVEAEGPRTVVFRVSGLIRLKRSCAISNPYITVAGQTAPGDGICLANYAGGVYGGHDAIIRFIRCRVGDAARKGMDGLGLGATDHSIIDHCSISWSSDEGASSRSAKNITFQRNIIAEALHHSYHYKASDRAKFETHAFAASISGNVGSFHHNLLAHCTDRNWSLAGGYNNAGQYDGYLDIRNNVVFNWTARTTDGGVMQCNFVNNYYKPYPANPFVKWLLKLDTIQPAAGIPKYHMAGNVMEGFDYDADNWKAFFNGPDVQKMVRVDAPLFDSFVTTQSARDAYLNVLKNVGATFPKQDVIDRRIIEEVRTGTVHYTGTRGAAFSPPGRNFPGIIDAPEDVKDAAGSPTFPWPEYRTYDVPVDSDHDGIPDFWEKLAGLNPNDPSDANQDRDGDGYTNLEKYLAWLVGEYPTPPAKPAARVAPPKDGL